MDTIKPRYQPETFLPGASVLIVLGVLVAAALAPSSPASGQARQSQDGDGYTIRGTVVNSVTHAAVARALVFSTDNQYAKMTDGEGHFEFKVPKPQTDQNSGPRDEAIGLTVYSGLNNRVTKMVSIGGVILTARKPGYFASAPRQAETEEEEGSSAEIVIELVPEALIVGRVNVAANDGTSRMQVTLYRRQVREGHAQWGRANSTTTRASGEFRFANLHAGDYKVFTQDAMDRDPVAYNPRQSFGYPPIYYPSASDFESAAVIHLKAGETFAATLTPTRTEYYPVRLGLSGAESDGGVGVEVETQGHRGPGFSLGYSQNNNSIQGLLPSGNYRIAVTRYGEDGATGWLDFSVNGAPVQGPSVTMAPNAQIEARVKDERTKDDNTMASGARNLLNGMNLTFTATDGFAQANYMRLRPPASQEDDTLVFGDLPPGSYRIGSKCQPGGYVAALRSGETDLLRQPLVLGLGAAAPAVEVTIRDDGAIVEGNIESWPPAGRHEPGNGLAGNTPAVVLLPAAGGSGQFCQTWASPSGEFNFQQVAPGEYLAIAFEQLPEDLEYDNAEAVKKLEAKGKVVKLAVEQKERLQLTLNASRGSE